MIQKAVLTAIIGVLVENVLAQGVQCSGSRTSWGISRFPQNSGDMDCWLQWSGWSDCSGHCGKAVKTADRKCRGNIPGTGGCHGSEIRRKRCSESEIVQGKGAGETYCPYWSFWAEWSSCQIQLSTDPCIRNSQGHAKRTRTCHDPYATERGETPTCKGEDYETRTCQDVLIGTPIGFQVFEDLPPGYQFEMQWSVCSANCGLGVQTNRLVHVCANVQGTWVPREEWYQSIERDCANSCCQAGDWEFTEDLQMCYAGKRTRIRSWISFTGGINDAFPGEDCSAIAASKNLRWGQGNQYIEEIVEIIPITFPEVPEVVYEDFFCNEPHWSTCVPQQSSYGPGLTTCNMNGKRTRTWKHCCSQKCDTTNQYHQWGTRPVAGNECEVWLQPPYVFVEEEPCGPPAEEELLSNHDPCDPQCWKRVICGNDILFEDSVECSSSHIAELTSTLLPEQCNDPAPCGCDQDQKTRTCTHQCGHAKVLHIQCSEHYVEIVIDEEWSETRELIAARNQGICICKLDERYHDFKQTWSREIAEDGQTCRTKQVSTETRINAYAEETCYVDEGCDETCDRPCDNRDQAPQVYHCFQSDMCLNLPNNMKISDTRQCPPKPGCCGWSQWTVETECFNGQCPSDVSGMRVLVRQEINEITGLPDEHCFNTEMRNEPCTQIACPAWPNWSEWSRCSDILDDGTVCGGKRMRSRDYLCKNDVLQGICQTPYEVGVTYSDGLIDNPFEQYDDSAHMPNSGYCESLYQENIERAIETIYLSNITNFHGEYNRVFDISQWEYYRDQVTYGCIAGSTTHYEVIRQFTVLNICERAASFVSGQRIQTETRMVQIPPCRDEFIQEIEYPTCGQTSGPCCDYNPNGCSAFLQFGCISEDPCGQSLPKSVPASAIQCPIAPQIGDCVEIGPCVPIAVQNHLQLQYTTFDQCEGTSTETCTDRCTGQQVSTPISCRINPVWSDWSSFVAIVPFDTVRYGVQRQYISEDNSLTPITVTCDPCGGILQSKKTLKCGPENSPHEIVSEIVCPEPQYSWSEWTQCGQSCYNSQIEQVCIQTRTLISHGAEHCGVAETQTKETLLLPCQCSCPRSTRFCQHPTDASATCGTGQVHEETQHNNCECGGGEILEYGQVSVTLVQVNGRVEQCELQFQPQWVAGFQSGCNSLDQVCNGGVMTQQNTLKCVEGRAPIGFQEKIQVEKIGHCPGRPLVQVVEKEDKCVEECQTSRFIYRECHNGVFEDNCECMRYGRQCCQRNPEYQLINNGTLERKTVPCMFIVQGPPGDSVDVPNPDCQCGICGRKTCMQDRCTGELFDCVETPSQPTQPEIHLIEECNWDILGPGMDKCNTPGYQMQQIVYHCIDNIIQSPPRIELQRVDNDLFNDARFGYNSQIIQTSGSISRHIETGRGNIQKCLLPRSYHTKRPTQCDYTLDRCNPIQIIQHISICDGVERLEKEVPQSCPVMETNEWTSWTSCSVECGQGIMTRSLIESCSGRILDTEERHCGCGISRWSEWSQWSQRTFIPCGPTHQTKTSSRTCISDHSSYTASNKQVEIVMMPDGNIKRKTSHTTSSMDIECSNRCNQCTGESDRTETLIPVQNEIKIETEQCPANPMDLCKKPFVFERIMECNKVVQERRIDCPLPPAPEAIESKCSVPCGAGTKTITTQASYCDSRVTTVTVPCQGRLGRIVDMPPSAWSVCSVSCGGGTQTHVISSVCELPDENNNVIEFSKKHGTQQCAMHPCAYWGGWSNWGSCSATCGSGEMQRSRKCLGGKPGTSACTEDDQEFLDSLFQGKVRQTDNGAGLLKICDAGDCCIAEWSGWSNCCIDGNNKHRIKWKVDICNGINIKKDQPCDQGNHAVNFQQCNDIYHIKNERIIEEIRTGNQRTFIYQDSGYGYQVDAGIQIIGEQKYILEYIGDQQIWYIEQPDHSRTAIDVEIFESKTEYGTDWYYRFGSNWSIYRNKRFIPINNPPPSYFNEFGQPVYPGEQLYSIRKNSDGQIIDIAENSNSPINLVVNQPSTAAFFKPPSQYSITAQTPNSGSNQENYYPYYRPLSTDQDAQYQQTVIETKQVTAAQPVATNGWKKINHNFALVDHQRQSTASNADSILFNIWEQ